jgi:acetyl-CoA carboxylase alpha subunit
MLGEVLGEALDELGSVPGEELRDQRRDRYRRLGIYTARAAEPALQPGS